MTIILDDMLGKIRKGGVRFKTLDENDNIVTFVTEPWDGETWTVRASGYDEAGGYVTGASVGIFQIIRRFGVDEIKGLN